MFLGALLFAAGARGNAVQDDFGTTPDGIPIQRWTISNLKGASVAVMSYGATVVSLKVPDRTGKVTDVVLGFDGVDGYLKNSPFFGAVVGRYGNRIAGGKFTLNAVESKLDVNDRGNTLHGGRRGFDKVVWSGSKIDDRTVEFAYLSKDGEEGFPGNLAAHVRYSLNDANTLKIEYSGTTDKDTVINLTNHSYFNLAGQGNGEVLKEELMIDADQFTPCDAKLIPTGEISPVEGTPFDFRRAHAIGDNISAANDQIRFARIRYELCFDQKGRTAARGDGVRSGQR